MEPSIVLGIAGAGVGLGLIALGAVASRPRPQSAPDYLAEILGADALDAAELDPRRAPPLVDRLVRPLAGRIADAAEAVTPHGHRDRVRTRLAQAGLDGVVGPEEVVAAQVVGLVVGLLAGLGLLATGALGPAAGLAVLALLVTAGALGPQAWLRRRVDRHVSGIRRDLPETLDLLAISVEAGLGLEGAMVVVVEESTGPLAGELARTLQEMELGVTRHDALTNLKRRSPVPELSTFVQALVQADVLGMPLAHVLRVQADQMRTKRRQWARERAGQLPVKIMFPLVACIFPAILVVILGPAVTEIGKVF